MMGLLVRLTTVIADLVLIQGVHGKEWGNEGQLFSPLITRQSIQGGFPDQMGQSPN